MSRKQVRGCPGRAPWGRRGRRGEEKKPAAPAGAETAAKDTSIILQLSTEQFEGKEKAPNEADSNQNQKETI